MSQSIVRRFSEHGFFVGAIATLFAIGLYINISKVLLGSKIFLLTTDIFVAALCAVAVVLWMAGRSRSGAAELLVLAFCLIGAAELFHPNVPSFMIGLEGFRRLVFQMLGLIIGIVAIKRRGDILFLWKLLAICAVPVLLYAIKQFFVISDFDQSMIDSTAADIDTWKLLGKIRSFGLFSGPFHLGIFAAIIFWIAVALRMQTRQRRYTILATIAVAACIASLTRASVVALVVSVPVVFFLIMRNQRKRVLLTSLTVLAVAITGFYVAKATSSTVASLVEGYSVLESLQDDGRLQGRFDDYSHAIRMFSDNPLGAGMGSASDALGSHFTASGGEHLTSHNLLLWVGIETGIVGLLLFLGLLSLIGLAIRKLIQLDDRPLAAAACGAMVTVLITGLTGSTLSAYPVNLIFWTLSGCYIGYLRTLEPERMRGQQ